MARTLLKLGSMSYCCTHPYGHGANRRQLARVYEQAERTHLLSTTVVIVCVVGDEESPPSRRNIDTHARARAEVGVVLLLPSNKVCSFIGIAAVTPQGTTKVFVHCIPSRINILYITVIRSLSTKAPL